MIYSDFQGKQLSMLGFGTMRLPTDSEGRIDEAKTAEMTRYAIERGVNSVSYTHLDVYKRQAYSPAEVEDKIYQRWQERGYFHAKPNPDKKPYSIVMPPPNITGQLHMGHGLDGTIQDAIIRFKRMQGYDCLLYTSRCV